MPRMTQKQELQNRKEELDLSHSQYKEIKKLNDLYKDYYRGKQWHGLRSDVYIHAVVDNIVFSNIRAIVPRLISRNPKIFVSPKKKPYPIGDNGQIFDTVGASMSLEFALNYYFKELETKREVRRCLYDSLLGHWGIMQLGYTLKTEKINSGKDGDLLIVDELIKSEELFAKRLAPDDFRTTVEGTDHLLRDRRWIATRWVKTLEDVMADDTFTNKSNLKPNLTIEPDFIKALSDDDRKKFRENADKSLWERVEGWTMWDKKTRRRMDIVDTHDKFLSNTKWPKWTDAIEGFPVEILYINENPDKPFPLPDIEIYRRAQDEINFIGSMQLDHLDTISERRYVAAEGAMDEMEEQKLLLGGRSITHTKGNPENKIIPLEGANISQDMYLMQRQKKAEIAEMAGVSQLEKSVARNFDTATEPALLNAGSQTLRDDQRGLVEDFIVRVIKKESAIIQATIDKIEIPLNADQFDGIKRFLNDPEPGNKLTREFLTNKLAKITGPENAIILQPWLELSSKDIKGEYEFDIEIGSTQPINQEIRKRDIMQLMQLNQDNPYIRRGEMTRKVFEVFEFKDMNDTLKSDQEVAQEAQAAQQAQQQSDLAERQMKDQTDLQKTQMKNQTALELQDKKSETVLLSELLKGKGNAKL